MGILLFSSQMWAEKCALYMANKVFYTNGLDLQSATTSPLTFVSLTIPHGSFFSILKDSYRSFFSASILMFVFLVFVCNDFFLPSFLQDSFTSDTVLDPQLFSLSTLKILYYYFLAFFVAKKKPAVILIFVPL